MGQKLLASDMRLPSIVERLKGGGTLIAESKALGFRGNTALRTVLRHFLGKDEYSRLMDRSSCNRIPVPKPDDEDAHQ